jgi:hypothetical protein
MSMTTAKSALRGLARATRLEGPVKRARARSRARHAMKYPSGVMGSEGIAALGHRDYVGGMWDEVGELQSQFMIAQGLQPHHVLLDIACGSLRGGVHLIPYLNCGNYLGIDKEAELVELGLRNELVPAMRNTKAPEFVISDTFEFSRFSKRPDFALAQSLFTHLTPGDITDCLAKLRAFAPECTLYASFFLPPSRRPRNAPARHDHMMFCYTITEMADFGVQSGWDFRYVGEWGHPRGQVMAEYRKVAAFAS